MVGALDTKVYNVGCELLRHGIQVTVADLKL